MDGYWMAMDWIGRLDSCVRLWTNCLHGTHEAITSTYCYQLGTASTQAQVGYLDSRRPPLRGLQAEATSLTSLDQLGQKHGPSSLAGNKRRLLVAIVGIN